MSNKMTDVIAQESMLFDYGTTYRTDYRHGQLNEPIRTVYKPKPAKPRKVAPPVKGVHVLCDWRDEKAPPFSLFHKPKPIIRTVPTQIQKPYIKPKDSALEEIIKTRPRVAMVPAACLDDAEDPCARAIILEDMYTTQTKKVMREAVAGAPPVFNVKAPLPPLTTAFNPLTIRRLRPPVVPGEWRKESAGWDRKQLRAYCDPDAQFWVTKDPSKCRACDEYKTAQTYRNMQKQMAVKKKLKFNIRVT